MAPFSDTLHVYVEGLLISAVCEDRVALDCGLCGEPFIVHTYICVVRPVVTVVQVKLKVVVSSTSPEGVLLIVGVCGTTAQ